jgi:2-phospho-L-lactate guanylyltransferase
MPTLIVPFRGETSKQRLRPLSDELRRTIATAMLVDVVRACREVGRTLVVTPDRVALDVEVVHDPGRGQGAAVAAALEHAGDEPVVVVNADVPCATARDVLALLGATPPGGLALAEAADGTTNALALATPGLFEPLYGPGSAERFRALADARTLAIPNLVDDVDSLADLERLEERLGPATAAAYARSRLQAAS